MVGPGKAGGLGQGLGGREVLYVQDLLARLAMLDGMWVLGGREGWVRGWEGGRCCACGLGLCVCVGWLGVYVWGLVWGM